MTTTKKNPGAGATGRGSDQNTYEGEPIKMKRTQTMARTTDKRKTARSLSRLVAANVRRETHRQGLTMWALHRRAHIRLDRMLRVWFGWRMLVSDLMIAQLALNTTTATIWKGYR